MDEPPKKRRGFAAMDPEKRREIARKGGKSVPNEKRTFSTDPDLAVSAGRLGGTAVDPAHRSFSRNKDLASKAGKKGAAARGQTAKSKG